MPVKRGLVAPQNIFIQTIIKKFDNSPDRNFVLGNAQVNGLPIIYSNDGFCELTGYSRAELMQKQCSCDFLCGEETNEVSARAVKDALRGREEKKIEIIYYKKDGTKFICSVVIAPVKSETGEVVMYIVNHEDVTWSPDRTEVDHVLKSGCLPLRKNSAKLVFKSNKLKPTKGTQNSLAENSSSKTTEKEDFDFELPNSIPLLNIHPPSPPEVSVAEEREDNEEETTTEDKPLRANAPAVKSSSLSDIVSGLKRFGSDNILHRSYSLLSGPATRERRNEHLPVNSHLSYANSRSESNLWNTQIDRESGMWSSKHSLELPRGSSLRIANALPLPQNALVPGTTEKVAQVMSLGADVLPEYKLQAPKIHPWTILHYSPFKAFWDWLVLFLVIYTAIVTPYMASFVLSRDRKREILNQDAETRRNYGPLTVYSDPLVIVDYIVDVMFIIDIFINFRTTFVDSHDEVVSNPCRIAVHYVKTWFAVDFVAAIPFELLIMIEKTDQATTLIGLLKTARLLRLVRVARKLDQYSEYGMAVLCLLMCSFALLAHWLACIWYAIGNLERERKTLNNIGWLDTLAEQTHQPYNSTDPNSGPDLESKYVTALYFTLSSLTSVGFGNVSPNTNAEKIFSISVMLIGSLFYAAIFGNVAAIIARLYSSTARYHSQMKKVREFIRFHQIPNPLRHRIEDYAHHMWSYTNGFDMDQVMKGFPECLQADICLHLNANLLCTMKVFQSASMGCLRAFALRLTTTHLPPGDYIVYQGDEVNHLFFIMRGTVEILRDDVIMAILGKGDTFGENFGENTSRPTGNSHASVRALTYCDLHSIRKEDLLYILRLYPRFTSSFNNDLEITYNLRHEVKENKPEYGLKEEQRHSNYSADSSVNSRQGDSSSSVTMELHTSDVTSVKPSVKLDDDLITSQGVCASSDTADNSSDCTHSISRPADRLNSHESEDCRGRALKETSGAVACESCCHTLRQVECRLDGLCSRLEHLETRLTSDIGAVLELLRVFKQDASRQSQTDHTRDNSQASQSSAKSRIAHTFV